MSKVRVAGFGVSLDGFSAGLEHRALEHPLGKRGEELFQWFFPTRTFRGDARGRRKARPEQMTRSRAGRSTVSEPSFLAEKHVRTDPRRVAR